MPSYLRPLGDGAGQPLPLRKRTTSLGRAEDNDVQALPRSVSGYHAEVELLDGGGAVLHDRGADGSGSRFGSFVSDDHFTGGWREVAHGDIIRLGTLQHGVAFRYEEDDGAPLPPPPRPEQFITEPETLQNAAKQALRKRNGDRKERVSKDEVPAAGRRSKTDVPVSVSYAVADGVRIDDQHNNPIGRNRMGYDEDMPLKEQKRAALESERRRLEEEKRKRDDEHKLDALREKRLRHNEENLSPRGSEQSMKHSLRYDEAVPPERPSQVEEVGDEPFSPPLPDPPSLPSLCERFESPRLPRVVAQGSFLDVEEVMAPALPFNEQTAVLAARDRAAASMRRLNQALCGARPFDELQMNGDLAAPGPAPAASQEIEGLRSKVASLTEGMNDESRLELKALQEQISALAPKVDGLVAKEGTGEDVQERMEQLREELCAALRDDVRKMLKKEHAQVAEEAPSSQLQEIKVEMERDRKERRRERKRDDQNALKEKVSEVLLRQQIGRPTMVPGVNLEELQANLEQPMIDLLKRLDGLQRDVTQLKNGTQKTKKEGELATYKQAVAALAARAPSAAPTNEVAKLTQRLHSLEAEVRVLRDESPPATPYRQSVVEAPAPRFQPDAVFSPVRPRRSLRGAGRAATAFGRRSTAGDDYRRDLAAVRREVDEAHARIAQVGAPDDALQKMRADLEQAHIVAERRHDALLQAVASTTSATDVERLNDGVRAAHTAAIQQLATIEGVAPADLNAVKRVLEGATLQAQRRHENVYAYSAPVPAPDVRAVLTDPARHGPAAASYWAKLRANVRVGKTRGTEVRRDLRAARAALDERLATDDDPSLLKLDEELRKTEQVAQEPPTARAALRLAFDACTGTGATLDAYRKALVAALDDPAAEIDEARAQVQTLDVPLLRELVRAPSIAQDRRRSLYAALRADLNEATEAAKHRAAQGFRRYAQEAQHELAAAPATLVQAIRKEIASLKKGATGAIKEGLATLLEDCGAAHAPAAAPEAKRRDALMDLQTELTNVVSGDVHATEQIKGKFRAYARRARLAHRDDVAQELADIRRGVARAAANAEAEAPVAALAASLEEFDRVAEAPAPAQERAATHAKVCDDLATLRREVSANSRDDAAVSEAVNALESRLQTYVVSLRADVPQDRDDAELAALREQVKELRAAHTLAKFGFGRKKNTKAKEDAKTLGALEAKIQAVQEELRGARPVPVVEAEAPPIVSAPLESRGRREGSRDDAVKTSDGLRTALFAQTRALAELTDEMRADRAAKRPPRQAWGDQEPGNDLRDLEDACFKLLDEDYGTSTETPLANLLDAIRAASGRGRTELRALKSCVEELRRVSTGIEVYDALTSNVDAFVEQARKLVRNKPVPSIRFEEQQPISPSLHTPPQSPTRSELSVTFRDDFPREQLKRQHSVQRSVDGHARQLHEEMGHLQEDNCQSAIAAVRRLQDRLGASKPREVRDLHAQLQDHIEIVREALHTSSRLDDDQYREGLRSLERLLHDQLRSLATTPSPSERALTQQVRAHAGNVDEAMAYLRESTARDTAADELRALNDKVGVLGHSHSQASERTVRAVDAALAEHAEKLERALQNAALNDVASRRELDDLRHLVDAARSNAGEATENQIARHAAALREEMAQTIRTSRQRDAVKHELKALKESVTALQLNPRDATTLLSDFKKQLTEHVEQVAHKLAATQDQQTRGHLNDVRSELKSVQVLATDQRFDDLDRSISRHASQLRDEMRDLHTRGAQDEVRVLRDRLSKVNEETSVVRQLEGQLREHTKHIDDALRRDGDRGDLRDLKGELALLREALPEKLERKVEGHIHSVKEELRHLREGATVEGDVRELQNLVREASGRQCAVIDSKLEGLMGVIRDAAESRPSRDLEGLEASIHDLRKEARDRQEKDDDRLSQLEQRVAAHAQALRDDFGKLREEGVKERTHQEISGLKDTIDELKQYKDSVPETLKRELAAHDATLKRDGAFGDLRRELKEVQVLCGNTFQTLEQSITQHSVALRDEMRHLRESSGARDRADVELRALRDKVAQTSNEEVVRNLERQLAQHASRVERAQESADRDVKSELQALGARIEQVRAAASQGTLEKNVEATLNALREELRALKDGQSRDKADDALKALAGQVSELRERRRDGDEHAAKIMERLEAQLGSHTRDLREAILSGQGERSELRDLQTQLVALREQSRRDVELIIAQTPKKEDISRAIEEKTSCLKEDIQAMRNSFARDAASDEVRALNETVRDLKRNSEQRSSTEELRLTALEERLARNADASNRALSEKDSQVRSDLAKLRDEVLGQVQARRDENVEAKLAEHASRLKEELRHALQGASHSTSTELQSLATKIASLESGGGKVASALTALEKQLSAHAASLKDTDLTTLRREVEAVRDGAVRASEAVHQDKFQSMQKQIDNQSTQAQFAETQKQLNEVKQRFAAKDASFDKLSEELSSLRRAKEAEVLQARQAETLALARSVQEKDAEIEALRKRLNEDISTPRDRGALFALRRQLARGSTRRLRRDLEDLRQVRASDARAARDALAEIARSLSTAPAPAPYQRDLADLREAQKRDADVSKRAIDELTRYLDGSVAEAPAPADLDALARQGDRAFENANLDAVRRRLRELAESATRSHRRADRLERDALKRLRGDDVGGLVDALLDQVQTLNASVFPDDTPRSDGDTPRGDALRRLTAIGTGRGDVAELRREVAELQRTSVGDDDAEAVATRDASDPERDRALVRSLRRQLARADGERDRAIRALARNAAGADAVNGYAEKQRDALSKAEHEAQVWQERAESADRNWAELVQERDAATNAARREAEACALRDEQWAEQLAERDDRVAELARQLADVEEGGSAAEACKALRDALLEQQAADLNRMRAAAARARDALADRDAVERRAGDGDCAAWRATAQLTQTQLLAAQAAQGSVGDVALARADADRLNLELARTLASSRSTTRSGVLRAVR